MKNAKKSSLSAVALAVIACYTTSAQAVYVHDIKTDIQYNELVENNWGIYTDISHEGDYDYYFNAGVKIVTGGNAIDITTPDNYDVVPGTKVNFHVASGTLMHIESVDKAMDCRPNAIMNFDAKGADLTFKVTGTGSDVNGIEVLDEQSQLVVNAHTMNVVGGGQAGIYFDGGIIDINLTGDFRAEDGDAGFAVGSDVATKKGTSHIQAKNIYLSSSSTEKLGIYSGLYVAAYKDDAGAPVAKDLNFIALDRMEIKGHKKGIWTNGAALINLTASDLLIEGKNAQGVMLNGSGTEASSTLDATALNTLTIRGYNIGAYLVSNSTLRVGASTAMFTGKDYGAYLTTGSVLEVHDTQQAKFESHWSGIYAEDSSIVDLQANKIVLQGDKYGLQSESAASTTVSANSLYFQGIDRQGVYLTSGSSLNVQDTAKVVFDGPLGAARLTGGAKLTTERVAQVVLTNDLLTYDASQTDIQADIVDIAGGVVAESGASTKVSAQTLGISAGINDLLEETVIASGADTLLSVSAQQALALKGKVKATQDATVNITGGAGTLFQGVTSFGDPATDKKGAIHVSLNDGGVWKLAGDSELTSLKGNGGLVDFYTLSENARATIPVYHNMKTGTLSGQNSLKMQIDLANEAKDKVLTNQFDITGKAEGSHIVDIKIDGRDLVPEKWHSENWLVSQGAGSNMTITNKDGTNSYAGNGMVTTWSLGFVGTGEESKLDSTDGLTEIAGTTTGVGEGNWYLVRSDKEAASEVQQIANLGISASQAMSFASELDDLRSRLGEVRYGAQDGLWVRAGHMKQTADGYNGRGFEQKTEDLHLGLDRLVATDENGSWLVGGALRYAKSDQEGFAAARGGDGELKQYSAKLYATYMHTGGSYADFVLQAGRYDQDIKGLANDKESAYSADYKTWGYGASIEAGHMFSFLEGADDRQWYNHAFIEPQLQLSYFRAHGKDFRTSTGLAVSQDDADFLTGRAGVVIGKKFNFATVDDLDKRYFQIGLTGGVKYEFLGDQDIRFTGVEGVTKVRKADDVDGARYYYGVTADWQFSDDFRAYAQIEREEGDHYTKDYDISVGLKYAF